MFLLWGTFKLSGEVTKLSLLFHVSLYSAIPLLITLLVTHGFMQLPVMAEFRDLGLPQGT